MSFAIALSGLNAATNQLGVTANNIANVETSGFKRSRAEFSELIAKGTLGASSAALAGVKVAEIRQQHTQGVVQFTENILDFAISGQGFFTVQGSEGIGYTRAGGFSVDRDGFVVNNNLQRLQVFPPTGDDTFASGTLEDLQISATENPPVATSLAEISLNLKADAPVPSVATFDPSVPNSFNFTSSMTVYDSLGGGHTARLFFAKDQTAASTWQSYFYIDDQLVDNGIVGQDFNELTFDSLGQLATPATGQFAGQTFSTTNGSDPITMALDFTGATQFGSDFVVRSVDPNGSEAGSLSGIEVSSTGVITARFTNGNTSPLGQLALARFANTEGLSAEGDTVWSETFDSGAAILGAGGSGDFGTIRSGALEKSNVDLTAELVDMVSAQRNFQANTQMLSTNIDLDQTLLQALR